MAKEFVPYQEREVAWKERRKGKKTTKVMLRDMQDESLKEAAWERQMNLLGGENFDRAHDGKDASETNAGKRVIRNMILEATDAIAQVQKDQLSVRRVPLEYRGALLMVPAETLALITVTRVLDRTYSAAQPENGYQKDLLCRQIGHAVEAEVLYRIWVKESEKAAEEYAKVKGLTKTPKSRAEYLMKEGKVSRTSLTRWREKFSHLSETDWTKETKIYVGEALVETLLATCPDTFEFHRVVKVNNSVWHVRMTDEAYEEFNANHEAVARHQSVRKPMLARPKPWGKVDADN